MDTTYLLPYLLHLADDALILSHRNSEWCGHGPMLEQDIALSNIALDGIGQARNFYQYAAKIGNNLSSEDALAFLRDTPEFKNCLLVELPNGDWGETILRIFFFSAYQYFLFEQLQNSNDKQLAAIAEKSLKEVTYHLRWSSEWVIRLGDGTEESKQRMQAAIENLWSYTGELFIASNYQEAAAAAGVGVNLSSLIKPWEEKVAAIFYEAQLTMPEKAWMQQGGRIGKHSEHLGYILAEMQFLQRAYPNANW